MDQKRAKTRFSGSFMGELSGDILSNIFLNLPVVSLLLCKCVCKAWRQLISDPVFANLHLNQHHQEKLLLKSWDNSFYSFNYKEKTHGNPVSLRDFPVTGLYFNEILGSCNGLLCMALNPKLLKIVLWNPSTGNHKVVPTTDPPIDNHQMVGFGYDSSVDDYKIVRIITTESKILRVDMYTLKTNLWKVINQDVLDRNSISFRFNHVGCALNKFIYWVGSGTIICFDLENNKFRKVALPWDRNRGSPKYLMAIRGRLCIREAGPPHWGDDIVWSLKEDEQKEEWIKLMTISSHWTSNYIVDRPKGPVCCLENGKILLCREQRGLSSKVNVYDILKKFPFYGPETSGTLEAFPIHGISSRFDWVTYIESLVSPN